PYSPRSPDHPAAVSTRNAPCPPEIGPTRNEPPEMKRGRTHMDGSPDPRRTRADGETRDAGRGTPGSDRAGRDRAGRTDRLGARSGSGSGTSGSGASGRSRPRSGVAGGRDRHPDAADDPDTPRTPRGGGRTPRSPGHQTPAGGKGAGRRGGDRARRDGEGGRFP